MRNKRSPNVFVISDETHFGSIKLQSADDGRAMSFFVLRVALFLSVFVTLSTTQTYEEPISDLLVKCNAFKRQIQFKNRTTHACEKKDPDGDFEYFIQPMKATYSKRDFLCVLFFKNKFTKLNFKLLFSHSQYKIDSYGIKFGEPQGNLLDSSVSFNLAVLAILPDKAASPLEILEWRINDVDMCPACGEKSVVRGLISGGTEVSAAQWPWHVSLWKKSGSTVNYICGGSIINKKWIVSAAHCMFNGGQAINENTLTIRIGAQKSLSASFKSFSVKSLIIHEKYDTETFENDIALMKIKEILTLGQSFRAICFAQLVELPQASVGTAVGYGSTDKSKEHSDALRQVDIPIVGEEDCFDSDPDFFGKYKFDGNFCAGELNVMKGVCAGDSGGGFYVRINNNWFLQGITSNTKLSTSPLNPTCNYASFALFTNVTFYNDWINDKLINA